MAATFNENLELSVVACVLQYGETYKIMEEIIEQNFFWWRPFGNIWKCYQNLNNEQLGIDSVSLINEMSRNNYLEHLAILSNGYGNEEAIDFILKFKVNKDNAETYAYELMEAHAARKAVEIGNNIVARVNKGERVSEIIMNVDIELGKISSMVGSKSNTISTARQAVEESRIETLNAMRGLGVIVPTGLQFLDHFIGGLARKRAIMISGGTGDGKSSMLSSIINKMTIENEKKHMMGWISLEMGKRECINRIVSNQTGISALRLDMGKILKDEFKQYNEWCDVIQDAPIMIEDSSELTFPLLKTKMRKMAEAGCVSIGIDQLELLSFPPAMQGLADHIKFNWGGYRIKAYAKEFDINAIILHQISRDLNKGQNRGKDVKPTAQDIASGGERGMDGVFIIRHNADRTESYNNCVKNRQGISGTRVAMKYYGERMRFEDADEQSPEGFDSSIPDDVSDEYENMSQGIDENLMEDLDKISGVN